MQSNDKWSKTPFGKSTFLHIIFHLPSQRSFTNAKRRCFVACLLAQMSLLVQQASFSNYMLSSLCLTQTRSATAGVNLDFRTARCTVCLSFHAAAAVAAAAGVLYFLCAQ
jgi:hypothetical protein